MSHGAPDYLHIPGDLPENLWDDYFRAAMSWQQMLAEQEFKQPDLATGIATGFMGGIGNYVKFLQDRRLEEEKARRKYGYDVSLEREKGELSRRQALDVEQAKAGYTSAAKTAEQDYARQMAERGWSGIRENMLYESPYFRSDLGAGLPNPELPPGAAGATETFRRSPYEIATRMSPEQLAAFGSSVAPGTQMEWLKQILPPTPVEESQIGLNQTQAQQNLMAARNQLAQAEENFARARGTPMAMAADADLKRAQANYANEQAAWEQTRTTAGQRVLAGTAAPDVAAMAGAGRAPQPQQPTRASQLQDMAYALALRSGLDPIKNPAEFQEELYRQLDSLMLRHQAPLEIETSGVSGFRTGEQELPFGEFRRGETRREPAPSPFGPSPTPSGRPADVGPVPPDILGRVQEYSKHYKTPEAARKAALDDMTKALAAKKLTPEQAAQYRRAIEAVFGK